MQQIICYMHFIEVNETPFSSTEVFSMSDTTTTTLTTPFAPILNALKDVNGQFQFGPAVREYVEPAPPVARKR